MLASVLFLVSPSHVLPLLRHVRPAADGKLSVFGWNRKRRLGLGQCDAVFVPQPTTVQGVDRVVRIAAGSVCSAAVRGGYA